MTLQSGIQQDLGSNYTTIQPETTPSVNGGSSPDLMCMSSFGGNCGSIPSPDQQIKMDSTVQPNLEKYLVWFAFAFLIYKMIY